MFFLILSSFEIWLKQPVIKVSFIGWTTLYFSFQKGREKQIFRVFKFVFYLERSAEHQLGFSNLAFPQWFPNKFLNICSYYFYKYNLLKKLYILFSHCTFLWFLLHVLLLHWWTSFFSSSSSRTPFLAFFFFFSRHHILRVECENYNSSAFECTVTTSPLGHRCQTICETLWTDVLGNIIRRCITTVILYYSVFADYSKQSVSVYEKCDSYTDIQYMLHMQQLYFKLVCFILN